MLAAIGHTNRAIGRTLFITESTVEQHLTSVYRKLNVRRRADLSAHVPLPSATWTPGHDEAPAMAGADSGSVPAA